MGCRCVCKISDDTVSARREFDTLAKVQHENVVRLVAAYATWVFGGTPSEDFQAVKTPKKDAEKNRIFRELKSSGLGLACESLLFSNHLVYVFMERLQEDIFARFTFIDYYTEEQVIYLDHFLRQLLLPGSFPVDFVCSAFASCINQSLLSHYCC